VIAAAAPALAPAAGKYTGAQSVTISDAVGGTTIYYTTDGTLPTSASTVYSGPIPVNANETLKAIAVASNYANSVVAASTYKIVE
jgi:LysM repeat protein